MIKLYERTDYEDTVSLLQSCGLPVLSPDELEGLGLLWTEGGKAIGFVWALVGIGATVYIDHFCVHPDYRQKDATGRSAIAVDLMIHLMRILDSMGKTRIQGILHKTDTGKSLERIYNRVGMKFAEPHAFVYGSIKDVVSNLIGAKNVQHIHH